MWILLVIIAVVCFCYYILASNNKTTKEHHLKNGGLRKSFLIMTNHLENFYGMNLEFDTGNTFSYSKTLKDVNDNHGYLHIGIKLDMRQEPLIFSKFESKFRGNFEGIDVGSVNFQSVNEIENGIKISLDRIKSLGVINYSDKLSEIGPAISQEFIESWLDLSKELKDTQAGLLFDILVNYFFIPDTISMSKFVENLDVLKNTWKGVAGEYGTISVQDIYLLPPLFDEMFVAAYPDVYKWFQENSNSGKVEIFNKINSLSDDEIGEYLNDFEKVIDFYRQIVNQFKKENTELECKQYYNPE